MLLWKCVFLIKCKYVLSYPVRPNIRKSTAFWKVSSLRPFVPLVRATCRWKGVWKLVEWHWQGIPQCAEKNLSQSHFLHYKSHVDWPGIEPALPQWLKVRSFWKVFKYAVRMAHCTLTASVIYQYISSVWGNDRCLFWEQHKTRVNALCVQDVEFLNVRSNHGEQPVAFKGLKRRTTAVWRIRQYKTREGRVDVSNFQVLKFIFWWKCWQLPVVSAAEFVN